MQERAGKYAKICLKALIILTIVLLWIARDSAAQQSVRLPQSWKSESEQLDEFLIQIDLAREQHRVKVELLQRDKNDFTHKSRLASPGAAREYYEEMIHQLDAELLLARYRLHTEIREIAYKATLTAGQLIVTIGSSDFGKANVEARIQDVHKNQTAVRERLRNYKIINEIGRLTENEQKLLNDSSQWQEQVYQLWLREARWYSELLNRVLQQSIHFRNATQFMENLIEDLHGVIQNSNREIASIRAIAAAERASAVRRL